jgi:hypothetical protein
MSVQSARVIGLLVMAIAVPGESRAQTPESLADLVWMAGCWEMERGTVVVEEQWMAPRGTLMLGMSRTIVDGRTREYEHISIHADSAGTLYVATPSRQARTEFRAVTREPGAITFENPQHDFPQRISYRSAAQGDSLVARIAGPRGGVERAIEFGYSRTQCPGARPPAGNPGGY